MFGFVSQLHQLMSTSLPFYLFVRYARASLYPRFRPTINILHHLLFRLIFHQCSLQLISTNPAASECHQHYPALLAASTSETKYLNLTQNKPNLSLKARKFILWEVGQAVQTLHAKHWIHLGRCHIKLITICCFEDSLIVLIFRY